MKKLDDGKKLSIEVTALNSYDVPIHIYYEGVPVTDSVLAIEDAENDANIPAIKFIKDGVLYIQRGEKIYTITGAQIRK